MTKIILFGANGMLGRYMYKWLVQFYEIICITRQDYDVAQSDLFSLDQIFIQNNCDANTIILNCIGMIPQRHDMITSKPSFIRVNAEFPHLLNAVAQRYGCYFIHITTDCVFNGDRGQYNETDIHTETGIYGRSKSLGEPKTATVIRTSIIGEELFNKTSLLEWVKSQGNKRINGYINHYWNGVTCLQLAKIVHKITSTNAYWIGVRHIFSPNPVAKYDLILMIARVYDIKIDIEPLETTRCDKTLASIYETNDLFCIPELNVQLAHLRYFPLL